MTRFKLLIISALSVISCAKSLEWADPQEPENAGDMVTVLFSASGGTQGKATGITDASERSIGRWAVFAFDDSSNWFRYATSDSGGDIPMNLRAGRQYTCFAIVNYSTSGTTTCTGKWPTWETTPWAACSCSAAASSSPPPGNKTAALR